MMIYTDQLDRKIEVLKVPKRIISLVPSQTELLVTLGLEDAIVGITKFCVHPKKLRKEKTIVGGTKKVNFETIRRLNPDIILCNKEENTKEIVENLQKEFVVHVSDIFCIEDTLSMIKQYGEIFKVEHKANQLTLKIETELKSFKAEMSKKPKKEVGYFIWKDPWIAVGNDTFIDHMLKLNNYENVFESKTRYPEISEEELSLLNDEVLILLSSEPYPFSEKHISELRKINKHSKVILVDGEYFSWYGSRLAEAFSYFRTLHE